MGPRWHHCPKKGHPPYISNSQGCPKCREEADRGISVGSAIGDSIITGDGNVVVVRYDDVEVKPIEQVEEPIRKSAISQDQAFERIGAAVRLNLSQFERNIEQARKESNQFFKLTLIFASIGFLVVVAGIALLLAGQVAAGIVATVSSTVPEVTAALFFKKDKELRKTIELYHQHMLESQRILTMVDVATTIADEIERDRMKRDIIYTSLNIEKRTSAT